MEVKSHIFVNRSTSQLDKQEDSAISDTMSIKSADTISVNSSTSLSQQSTITVQSSSSSTTRAHNFMRKHFQRATQCDFCGKKIWLKDAVQCRECSMCCHKKCVTKCQNATVCGPVDCSTVLAQPPTPTISLDAPEFMVTEPGLCEASEGEEALAGTEDEAEKPTALETHRSSLSGLLAQGIKRVNSANNLAIPGIVSTLTGGSLPPSPSR